jgi:hypothetical protein
VEERAPPLDVLALQQARKQQQRLPPHQLARVAQARGQPGHRTARTKEKGGCQRGGGVRTELASQQEPGWQSSLNWYCSDAQVKTDGEAPKGSIRGEQEEAVSTGRLWRVDATMCSRATLPAGRGILAAAWSGGPCPGSYLSTRAV